MKDFLKNIIAFFPTTLLGVLSPLVPVILTMGFLVGVEFLTSYMIKVKKNEEFTKTEIKFFLLKCFLYLLILLTVFLTQQYIYTPVIPVLTLVASLIATLELKGIGQNCFDLLGFDVFKDFFEYLKKNKEGNTPN